MLLRNYLKCKKKHTYNILLKSYFSDSNSRVTSTIKSSPIWATIYAREIPSGSFLT